MAEEYQAALQAQDGILEVPLQNWRDFVSEIHDFQHHAQYIWRGQEQSDWDLEPSLDRLAREYAITNDRSLQLRQLIGFRRATRGRRGPHPEALEVERDWWALGQLNGLATPLLDWTESPFIALYFAFVETTPPENTHRAVFALSTGAVRLGNEEVRRQWNEEGEFPPLSLIRLDRAAGAVEAGAESFEPDRPPVLEVFSPEFHEARLVNQSGWFTQAPPATTVEKWVRACFPGDNKRRLIKWLIPDDGREDCLVYLNRMNINHLSLFPDLLGAALHSNKKISIPRYGSLAEILTP